MEFQQIRKDDDQQSFGGSNIQNNEYLNITIETTQPTRDDLSLVNKSEFFISKFHVAKIESLISKNAQHKIFF